MNLFEKTSHMNQPSHRSSTLLLKQNIQQIPYISAYLEPHRE
jgi:hypothetical protein